MLPTLFRRVVFEALPTLLFLLATTFILLRLVPGGPFDGDRAWPPEIKRQLEAHYGLDLPLPAQLLRWLKGLAKGDLGESMQYLDRPVTTIIGEALPVSLSLGVIAFVLSTGLGLALGGLAAGRRGSWLDRSVSFATMVGLSLPAYLPASVLVLVFALWLGWLPPARWDEPFSFVLPALTLSIRPTAIVARLTRASTLEALGSDYMRTALGKGLSMREAVFKHAVRNSLVPVLSQLGQVAAHLLTGSFLVETIFQVPGIGTYFVQAVLNRDYPLVMGLTLVYGTILLMCNLAVDFAYVWADPRIRVHT